MSAELLRDLAALGGTRMRPINGTWTEERIGKLKVLWLQGLSATAIAAQLGGFAHCVDRGRSAVLGKAWRLGLPPRGEEKAHRTGRPYVRAVPAKKFRQLVPKLKPEPLPKPRAPVKGPDSIQWIHHTRGQCEMFCAGEEGAYGFVCGKPVAVNAWCEECARLVFNPEAKKSAA